MRLLWTGEPASFHGAHFSFTDVTVQPTPMQEGGPSLWLAGGGAPALRRVGVLADGWLPHPPTVEGYASQGALERRILMPILDRVFGATYEDMRRMERTLQESSVDWIALRPPRLQQMDATGAYRLDSKPLPRGRAITYPDLARALLDVIENPQHSRQALYVSN